MKNSDVSLISEFSDELTQIEDYIKDHIDPEDEYLHQLYRATHLHLLYPRMASGHIQGRLLKMFVQMIKPKLILEIGTYSGYSGLCMAEGLEDGGHLHTIEINDEQEDFTLPWFKNSKYADKITMHIGDAMKIIPKLGLQFDMAFIDGDKRIYSEYYELVLKNLAPGGYILADNTLWDGHVLDKNPKECDLQTRGVQAFNNIVAKDSRVEKVILPIRDGLTIIRKKQ
ncbi:MAG: O-methyltransferase [Bacteroidaceae bacterium]|nr:O-methyltransferase [Bacteroidaceae bacterium]